MSEEMDWAKSRLKVGDEIKVTGPSVPKIYEGRTFIVESLGKKDSISLKLKPKA